MPPSSCASGSYWMGQTRILISHPTNSISNIMNFELWNFSQQAANVENLYIYIYLHIYIYIHMYIHMYVHLPTGSLKIGCPWSPIEASVEKEALPTADSPPWLWETWFGSRGPVVTSDVPSWLCPKMEVSEVIGLPPVIHLSGIFHDFFHP